MKRISITLVFLLLILTLSPGKAYAQDNKFFDVVGEIAYGEECLKTWQIDEASAIANKLLSTAAENPYVCFFAGEVRFYEGNYQESLSFLKRHRKNLISHGMPWNFMTSWTRFIKRQASSKRLKPNTFCFAMQKIRMPYWSIMP